MKRWFTVGKEGERFADTTDFLIALAEFFDAIEKQKENETVVMEVELLKGGRSQELKHSKTQKPMLTLKSIPIGQYLPFNGKWEVRFDKDSWFSCGTQVEAEILSRLVRLGLKEGIMSEARKLIKKVEKSRRELVKKTHGKS